MWYLFAAILIAFIVSAGNINLLAVAGLSAVGVVGLVIFLSMRDVSIESESNRRAIDYEANNRKEIIGVVKEEVARHMAVLARKRFQAVRVDDYGIHDISAWRKEADYFIESVIVPIAREKILLSALADMRDFLFEKVIDVAVREHSEQLRQSLKFDDNMSPIDFEHFCANQLRKMGWTAQTTKASGDQGADVVASIGIHKVCIQCKLYSHPVGNYAVQEVSAARAHVGAQFAAVVTNSTYTKSAKELAVTNDVHLIHYSDLSRLKEILSLDAEEALET